MGVAAARSETGNRVRVRSDGALCFDLSSLFTSSLFEQAEPPRSSRSPVKGCSPLFAAQATTPALTAWKLRNRHTTTLGTGQSLGLAGGFCDDVCGHEPLPSFLHYRKVQFDQLCFSPY